MSVVRIKIHKEPVVFCLKLPLRIVLGATDQSEENIYVRIGGVQTEIRNRDLQSVSQKRYRLNHPAR